MRNGPDQVAIEYLAQKGRLYADAGRRSAAVATWKRMLGEGRTRQRTYERVARLYEECGFTRELERLRAKAARNNVELTLSRL